MSDLKLFRIDDGNAVELSGSAVALEKHLQNLIEKNMETLFGVHLLASEYSTGAKHGGRIDSIGIDENGSPVIFEYKRATNENVINQGLFYLDWLLDHRAEFQMLVMKVRGNDEAAAIDWDNPRLVCVAGDFTRYDQHAVQQIDRSIELVRYRDFRGELLALELLTATTPSKPGTVSGPAAPPVNKTSSLEKTVSQLLAQASQELQDLYADLDAALMAQGDDIQMTVRKNYFAYKRLKNFACVEVHPQTKVLLVHLKIDPDSIELEKGFSRDMRRLSHFGTGDLELRIRDSDDLAKAEPLLKQSYDNS